jgi:NAD(P)H-dependent flavin oxidoreductase YrpB (nitropropane dioxygenase family)
MLGGVMVPPEPLREMIRNVRRLTVRSFGVDLITDFVAPEHIDVCVAEQAPVVVFFWGFPQDLHLQRLRDAGIRLWMQVGSVGEARGAVERGFDAIVVQGKEAGGHNRSTAGTFSLVPAIVDTVAPVPVIAGGGISDGRGLAALALGAEAVWDMVAEAERIITSRLRPATTV